ncbi:MAG: aspartate kinase [Nitrososphaerales archaeon]|nr:aspartate kinase [Nitrososphaerales archaeon]
MRIIMKFGGSLIGAPGGPRRIAEIVSRHAGDNSVVVVVSALDDVTDALIEAAEKAAGRRGTNFEEALGKLRRLHGKAVAGTSLDAAAKKALLGRLDRTLEELRTVLAGVSTLGELSPRSRDMILSVGERLAAPIVSAELEHQGIASRAFTGGEVGIVTDGSFGEAFPDLTATRRNVRRTLLRRLSKAEVPVLTGFIARTKEGDITTLGRGGSDYTATIIGSALDADEVWIWTDVDGIMTGDPGVVSRPKLIEQLSYAEAEELAFFGAKNMHPLALGPARVARIPVRIRNGLRPNGVGTLITTDEKRSGGVVKSVATVKHVGLLTVSGETLQGRPGIAARVFAALAAAKVNILMISQSVSEANISMVVRRNALRQAKEAISTELAKERVAAVVATDAHVAVVAAVGAGMRGTKGVAAKVFGAVAARGINVKMIAQGSSELNISFVVEEKKANDAARAVHALVVTRGSRR